MLAGCSVVPRSGAFDIPAESNGEIRQSIKRNENVVNQVRQLIVGAPRKGRSDPARDKSIAFESTKRRCSILYDTASIMRFTCAKPRGPFLRKTMAKTVHLSPIRSSTLPVSRQGDHEPGLGTRPSSKVESAGRLKTLTSHPSGAVAAQESHKTADVVRFT